MNDIELAEKTCLQCGETKGMAEFYRDVRKADGRHTYCKPCARARAKENAARRRAVMGEEAWRELQRSIVAKSRARPEGRNQSRAYQRARGRALQRLADLHRSEYERLLTIELREEGL